MSPQASPALRKKLAAQVALLAALAALCGVGLMPGSAQSVKDEREVEEKIPAHLPIKVKLRKPEKVKDSKNEEWLGDLEVEVKNTGEKPIYYVYIALSLPDVLTEDETNVGYALRYGRAQLWEPSEQLQPDDVPIPPGETVVLKVPGNLVGAWKSFRSKGRLGNPKKLLFRFQGLSFGNGMGYWTAEGIPYPRKKASNASGAAATTATAGAPPSWPRLIPHPVASTT